MLELILILILLAEASQISRPSFPKQCPSNVQIFLELHLEINYHQYLKFFFFTSGKQRTLLGQDKNKLWEIQYSFRGG